MSLATAEDGLLFSGADWDFETIQRVYDAIEKIASGELGLETYATDRKSGV